MTAPMVVTNWINLQYHASTVDNLRYGSGSKLLHNVVGDNVGVFEGNGGDLRIGLPMQSLHDEPGFRHTPLRLSVYIQVAGRSMRSSRGRRRCASWSTTAGCICSDWRTTQGKTQGSGATGRVAPGSRCP
jgi:uncharacterized protein YbcC (UPF0753/DUF2309 family)